MMNAGLQRSLERREQHKAATLEDLEWIIDTDHPERVAARLGYARPEYLIRCLYRWGRMDLAVRLEHGNRLERAS